MQDAPAVRKEFEIRAPSAPQLELRLHWFGRALEARCGYIVHVDRRLSGPEHVAAVAYEMPLPRYARRSRRAGAAELTDGALSAAGVLTAMRSLPGS
jgi:hypothetical protein